MKPAESSVMKAKSKKSEDPLILKIWRSMRGGVDIYTPGGADTLEELKA